MSASPEMFADLLTCLAKAKDPKVIDMLLDKYYEYKYLATDWDATQWGFIPGSWMLAERLKLDDPSKSSEVRASNT